MRSANNMCYRTTQGDMWDSIARQVYGNEFYMHILVDANPKYRTVVIFSANCILTIPEITRDVGVSWPPWRAG